MQIPKPLFSYLAENYNIHPLVKPAQICLKFHSVSSQHSNVQVKYFHICTSPCHEVVFIGVIIFAIFRVVIFININHQSMKLCGV